MVKKKVLGLKITAPERADGVIYPSVIGWALVEVTERPTGGQTITGIKPAKALKIAREQIGKHLREIRERKEIEIAALATAINEPAGNVNAMENGESYSFDTFLKVVNGLDCFFYLKDRDGQHLNAEALKNKS